jgi:ABC-2 type transport system ATP-binding protein
MEGLLAPSGGDVEVLGMRWSDRRNDIRERVGITLQETRLAEKLTVHETLALFRSFYRAGREPADLLALVNLAEKAGAWVQKLSGGQKQRLAIACGLAGDPELLFLDEPTTGLDPQARRDIWDIIRSQKQRGRTTLVTTHYMDEAERLCDRVAVVDKGRVIAHGSPAELIAQIGGEHVIEFAVESNGDPPPGSDELLALPTVNNCHVDAGGFALTVEHPHVALPALLGLLERCGWKMSRISTRHVSLEDVFIHLTGRHLTEDERKDSRQTP